MAWKDDEFIKESEGQGYGGPSMDEIATRIQNKIIRWGAVIYDKFYLVFCLSYKGGTFYESRLSI